MVLVMVAWLWGSRWSVSVNDVYGSARSVPSLPMKLGSLMVSFLVCFRGGVGEMVKRDDVVSTVGTAKIVVILLSDARIVRIGKDTVTGGVFEFGLVWRDHRSLSTMDGVASSSTNRLVGRMVLSSTTMAWTQRCP